MRTNTQKYEAIKARVMDNRACGLDQPREDAHGRPMPTVVCGSILAEAHWLVGIVNKLVDGQPDRLAEAEAEDVLALEEKYDKLTASYRTMIAANKFVPAPKGLVDDMGRLVDLIDRLLSEQAARKRKAERTVGVGIDEN